MDNWKLHQDDPELQKRKAYKDKLHQKLRKLEADAAAPRPAPKPKAAEPTPPPPPPRDPGVSDDLLYHLNRGPKDTK